ncbi:unnamed protein product [Peniophora sp. CBMAI 1063]|nr:unnamed protein product [Peniophora sp. CBMAI 1063]
MSSNATITESATEPAASTSSTKQPSLSAMSDHKGVSTHFIFGSVIFLVVTLQTLRYFLKKGTLHRRETSRVVTCLWLLNAIHYMWLCHQAFVLPNMSKLELDLPMISILTLTFFIFVVYIGVSIFIWKKCRIMTASRIYASLLVLVPWLPVMGYKFFLTHVSAIAPIGFSGAMKAMIAPKSSAPSQCPRLRMPSGLAADLQRNTSQRRTYLFAFGLLAVNGFILWFLSTFRITGHNYLPGGILYESHFGLEDFYTIVYLGIKLRNAPISRPAANTQTTSEAVAAQPAESETPSL